MGLVGKVNGNTHLEALRIKRIVRNRKIVVSTKSFAVDMGVGQVEPCFFKFEICKNVHYEEITTILLVLIIETHVGRVVVRSLIAGVVVAVNTQLHMEHTGDSELKVEIAIYGELW